ncbi:stage III sporulation protein AD [Clostridium sp. BJN0001]|uniref:stage III sporulation protein AD n=1 Tax=Clostridium sp. BJN0001 TaxID=2930219 RepID=UPI001FD35626|nr:stage III sporulation protein AD [Clostridium sp. BJN0001]
MLIIRITSLCFIALFLILMFKSHNKNIAFLIGLLTCAFVLSMLVSPIKEIINFIKVISTKSNIDAVYIEIVFKVMGIAYICTFASSLCKDADAQNLASQIDFAGKIMILTLAIPILMAVLDSIIKIM